MDRCYCITSPTDMLFEECIIDMSIENIILHHDSHRYVIKIVINIIHVSDRFNNKTIYENPFNFHLINHTTNA